MSVRTASWTVFAAIILGLILLFNYWASYQLLSTLVYAGIVAAVLGAANLVFPFRFLGVRKRFAGALILVGGVGLAIAALLWPAPMFHVSQHRTGLDDVMPEYQFFERHSVRVHARPEQAMEAIRQSTFGDMKSLAALLKVRAAALHIHNQGDSLGSMRVLDGFSKSGYVIGGSEHEIVMAGGASLRANDVLRMRSLQEFADYREPGAVKMAFDFNVEDAGGGWCTVSTVTRVLATDDSTRSGVGRYWRLIVPGSGLLRRQWLDAIKKRAENAGGQAS